MKNIIFGIFFTLSMLSSAQELEDCGIVFFESKSILSKAPEGWVLDCEAGLPSHIPIVFYKKGTTYLDAETVMYINYESLGEVNQENLEDLISYDEEQFKKKYGGIEIKTIDDFKLEKYNATVRYFGKGDYPSHEYIAYLDLKKFALMVVISSKSESALKEESNAFVELLNSMKVLKVK